MCVPIIAVDYPTVSYHQNCVYNCCHLWEEQVWNMEAKQYRTGWIHQRGRKRVFRMSENNIHHHFQHHDHHHCHHLTCSSARSRLRMGLVTAHWLAVLLDIDSNRRMLKRVSISPDSSAGSRERCPFNTCIAGVSFEAFLKWYVARWSMVAAHCDASGASSPCGVCLCQRRWWRERSAVSRQQHQQAAADIMGGKKKKNRRQQG